MLEEAQDDATALAAAVAPGPSDSADPLRAAVAREYETIFDQAALDRWLAAIEQADLVTFDIETTSLDPMQARIVGISFAIVPGRAAYVPVAHRYAGAPLQLPLDAVLARLKPWLENPRAKKLGQNVKYDQHVLANHGIVLAGVALATQPVVKVQDLLHGIGLTSAIGGAFVPVAAADISSPCLSRT